MCKAVFFAAFLMVFTVVGSAHPSTTTAGPPWAPWTGLPTGSASRPTYIQLDEWRSRPLHIRGREKVWSYFGGSGGGPMVTCVPAPAVPRGETNQPRDR